MWSLEGGDTELTKDWTWTDGLSGDEALTLDSTGVMLQDCDARSDDEDKLCDCPGSDVVVEDSVGVPLAFLAGGELWVMPLSGVSVYICERTFGVESLLLENCPLVAKTLSGVVDDLLPVDVSPIVSDEHVSILDDV